MIVGDDGDEPASRREGAEPSRAVGEERVPARLCRTCRHVRRRGSEDRGTKWGAVHVELGLISRDSRMAFLIDTRVDLGMAMKAFIAIQVGQ